MASKPPKLTKLTSADIVVLSTDSDLGFTAKQIFGEERKINITDLVKYVKDSLDASGVASWKATLELSFAIGGIGVKGSVELGNK